MRPRVALAAIGALATVAALGACSNNKGENGSTGKTEKQQGAISTNPADSKGPAAPVAGAKPGGTMHIMIEKDYEHLDPTRTYVVQPTAIEQLFSRQLTTFKQDSKGKLTLVGDMATDAGKDISGSGQKCTKWQYTLKDGLKFDDGTPITAQVEAYSLARSFSPQLAEGAHYVAQWLSDSNSDYNKSYQGPFNGAPQVPPGLTVTGDKTLTFTFKHPHCDLPFALQMPVSSPVEKAKDDFTSYDNHPVSSGPYKIPAGGYIRGTSLKLVKNDNWDAKTDPYRHQYPNEIDVTIGPTDAQQAQRLIADNGDDQTAAATQDVPQAMLPQAQQPDVKKRAVAGQTSFTYYMAINTQHVPDLKERQALNYAADRTGIIQLLGGPAGGTPATTMLSPTTIGWKNYNTYPAGDHGNPQKAKELLAGKHPKLVFGYRNNALGQKEAPFVKSMLEKAGFQVQLQPVDADHFFSLLEKKNNPWDIYITDWAADWPSGSTVIPVLFDGRTILPDGNEDTSYWNDDAINKKFDTVSALPANEAAPKWAELDQEQSKGASTVPLYYKNGYTLMGSKLGGVLLSSNLGTNIWVNSYVKQ